MNLYRIEDLSLDMRVYPRAEIDLEHVMQIKQAIIVGVKMPPPVICRRSKRVADGFHRLTANRQIHGDEYEIECVERDYADDRELFLDSMRMNAGHGKALTTADKQICAVKAKAFQLSVAEVAKELSVENDYCQMLRSGYQSPEIKLKNGHGGNHAGWGKRNERRRAWPEDAQQQIDALPVATLAPASIIIEQSESDSLRVLRSADELIRQFEAGTISGEGKKVREKMEILNWHIEEVFGFSAK